MPGQKRTAKKKGAKRHVGKIKLTRKGKKGNTLDCGHLNVEYFLVHKNLADSSLAYAALVAFLFRSLLDASVVLPS